MMTADDWTWSSADPRDDGAARDTRPVLCTLRAWCVLEHQHEGACVEVPRQEHAKPDYGPVRAEGMRW